MSKITQYVKDSYTELMEKVTWPTWAELRESAIIVMVASVIIGFVVYLMDLAFSGLLTAIYSL